MNLSEWKITDLEPFQHWSGYAYSFNLERNGEKCLYHISGFRENEDFNTPGRYLVFSETAAAATRRIKQRLRRLMRQERGDARRQARANRRHARVLKKRQNDKREVQL